MTNQVPRAMGQDERGTTIVIVTLFMATLFGFAALSIDVSHVFQEQRRAQIAADASSFAAVALLTNASASKASIIQEANNIALANGIKPEEIAANPIGQIQVGKWDTNSLTFTPDATPYNAVRVPARRTVPLAFGKVVGLSQMTPAVRSVSMLTRTGSAVGESGAGLIPFAVHPAQGTNAFYVPYSFDKHDIGSGNFGKMNLNGDGSWADQMLNGCNCAANINDFVGDIPGNAKIQDGFEARMNSNPYAVLAVFDYAGPGNSNQGEVITGFVGVKILSVVGNGNWTVTVMNVPMLIAGGGGGSVVYGQSRVLVQ